MCQNFKPMRPADERRLERLLTDLGSQETSEADSDEDVSSENPIFHVLVSASGLRNLMRGSDESSSDSEGEEESVSNDEGGAGGRWERDSRDSRVAYRELAEEGITQSPAVEPPSQETGSGHRSGEDDEVTTSKTEQPDSSATLTSNRADREENREISNTLDGTRSDNLTGGSDLSEGTATGSSAAMQALQIAVAMRKRALARSVRRPRKLHNSASSRLAQRISRVLSKRISGVWSGGPVENSGQYLHRCAELGGTPVVPASGPNANDGLFVGALWGMLRAQLFEYIKYQRRFIRWDIKCMILALIKMGIALIREGQV